MSLEEYYRRRAQEYEDIYDWCDPYTQEEQVQIADAMKESLRDRRIIEVACGTGYWTRITSETAQSIVATDIVDEVMNIAKMKLYSCPVSFQRANAYNLTFEDDSFNGGLAVSWFSHIPRDRISSFLKGFHRILQDGSRVFIMDNVYIPGVGGELIRKKGDGNTYKLRTLRDGSRYTIVKNYFSTDELVDIFGNPVEGFGEENIFHGNCFWYVDYELR